MPTAVTWLVLLAATAAPGGRAEPPKKADPPATLTDIENAAITIPAGTKVKYEVTQTPAGARIRLTIGDVILEAARLKVRMTKDGKQRVISLEPSADGKAINSDSQDEPAPAKKR